MTDLTNAEKVRIVKRHTEDDVPLTELSDEYGVSPDQIYTWQRQLAEATVSRRFLDAGLVTRDQLRRALVYQRAHGGRTVDALIELSFLRPEIFVNFMAQQPGIPSLNLRQYKIDSSVAALVSKEFAEERLALPIDRLGRLLTVAMACPLDDDTIREISKLTGLRTKPVFAEQLDIEWAIERLWGGESEAGHVSNEPAPIAVRAASHELRPLQAPDIVKMIGQVSSLPLVPGSNYLLQQAMATGSVNEENLARIMKLDPLMAARLLALANAEPFGQTGQVYSLRQAIRLLGPEKACTLVSAADTILPYSHWQRFSLQGYWTDALCCAKAASLLAERCGMGRDEDFYTAGLLHDIGRIVLFEILPQHYVQTDVDTRGIGLLIQENELVGMPHSVAGYELAKHWHLPVEFAEAIRSHHFPEQAQNSSDFSAVVSIGNVMADRAMKSGAMDDESLDECRVAMKMIGLEEQALRSIFDDYLTLLPALFLDDVAV